LRTRFTNWTLRPSRTFGTKMRKEIEDDTAPHGWGKSFVQLDYTKHGIDELALNNTIVGLLSNPGAIAKCHEELDRVVGEDRTPAFEDMPNLHWIWALVKLFKAMSAVDCRKRCGGGLSPN